MKNVLILLGLVGLVSCGSYVPPKQYNVKKSFTVQKSFDNTWQKIINYFAVRNIPIRNLDKSSGFISTEYQLMANDATAEERKSGIFKDCDCGEPAFNMFFDNPNCNFNITLSKTDSLLTEVGINVFYRCDWKYVPYGSNGATMLPGTPLQGNSTGNFEKDIFEYISK